MFDDDGIVIRFMNSNVQVGHLHSSCSIKWAAPSSLPWLRLRGMPAHAVFLLQLMATAHAAPYLSPPPVRFHMPARAAACIVRRAFSQACMAPGIMKWWLRLTWWKADHGFLALQGNGIRDSAAAAQLLQQVNFNGLTPLGTNLISKASKGRLHCLAA